MMQELKSLPITCNGNILRIGDKIFNLIHFVALEKVKKVIKIIFTSHTAILQYHNLENAQKDFEIIDHVITSSLTKKGD